MYIIGWLLFWYIIFKLTGFHLLTITINNGILFNGISFHTKRYLISVGSLRFRLWGNSKMTIIDDLTIKLLPNVKNNQNKILKKSAMTIVSRSYCSSGQYIPQNRIRQICGLQTYSTPPENEFGTKTNRYYHSV